MPSARNLSKAGLLTAAALFLSVVTDRSFAAPGGVLVSQFRVEGPNGGTDEFVEIVNTGAAAVAVGGWRLQGCAAGSGAASDRATIPAGTMLSAGQSYLFAGAGYTGGTTANQSFSTGIANNGNSGLRIVNAATVAQDGVGMGTGLCVEGTARTTVAGVGGYSRIGNGSCSTIQDTENNAADFASGIGGIRNSSSAPLAGCGGAPVLSIADSSVTEGDAGTVLMTFTVSISSAPAMPVMVNYATAANSSATAGSDYADASGTLSFAAGSTTAQTFTVTVNGDTLVEGNETFLANLSGATPGASIGDGSAIGTIADDDMAAPMCSVTRTIMQIQGAGHLTAFPGAVTTSGIITARDTNGFYLQNPDGDGNPNTSDAIFVFTSSAPAAALAVGDQVCVSGNVIEFRPGGAASTNLTITEITGPTVTEIPGLFSSSVVATVLGAGGRQPPVTVIDNDTVDGPDADSRGAVETESSFDPAEDGIDFYESLEGMLVRINDAVAVSPTSSFSEIWVLADGGSSASGRNARGGITLTESGGVADYNPERIQLDDGLEAAITMPMVNVGDGLGTVTGILDYSFGNYEVLLASAPLRSNANLPREVTTLVGGNGVLTASNYNVENLDAADAQVRFDAIALQIVNNLRAPDVLALQEVQDNNGATNDAVVDADATLTRLRDAVVAAGGPNYQFVDIDPVDDQDGGEPGGNIRVAYFYNPARVTLVPGTAGGSTEATQPLLDGTGKLSLSRNPGRLDPTNTAFNSSRKPLAAVFEFNGQRIVLVNNHFTSKGGSEPLYGRFQPPLNGGEAQRSAQASVVKGFVDNALALSPNARIAVMGDLNEFSFNPPLQLLRGAPVVLHDLVDDLISPAPERHGYIFEGNSETLDHILVTDALLAGAQVDIVNINSEYADQISDHDPDLAAFVVPPCVAGTLGFAAAPYSITEANGAVTLAVNVQRTGGSCGAVAVDYATGSASGTNAATTGADFLAASGTLSWTDGDSGTRSFAVTVQGDTLNELDEIFGLGLAGATNGAVLEGGGSTLATTATIFNDDPLPRLSFTLASSSTTENAGMVAVELALDTASGRDVRAPFTTGGSATQGAGSDYLLGTASPLTIAAGQTARTISLTLNDDTLEEPLETIRLTLDVMLENAALGDISTHELSIAASDGAPPVAPAYSASVVSTRTQAGAVPQGPAGRYFIDARFCNTDTVNLVDLESLTTQLTNGNRLISRTADSSNAANPGGTGSRQRLQQLGDYADGVLAGQTSPDNGECAPISYEIGLANRNRFTFTVNLLGNPQ